jgi:hypothetical protein
VADAVAGNDVLVAEAKRTCSPREARSVLADLSRRASRVPALEGRPIKTALFVMRQRGAGIPSVIGAAEVVDVLR